MSAANLGFAGDVLGTIASAWGANENRKLQKDIAQKGIRWRVADLKAAGLNPMLAVTGSGGLGSSGQVNPPNPGQSFEGIGSKYIASRIASAQLKLLEEQANQASSAAALSESQVTMNHTANEKQVMENDILREVVPYSAENARSSSERMRAEADSLAQEVIGRKLSNDQALKMQPLLVDYQRTINELEALGIPEKKAAAQFFETVPGAKWVSQVSSILGVDAAKVMSIFRKRAPSMIIDKSKHVITTVPN